jgi:hypothetical protein
MNDYTDNDDRYNTYADKHFVDPTDNEVIYAPRSLQATNVAEISEQDILENFKSPLGYKIKTPKKRN